MPLYNVKIWYTTHVTTEVQAKDAEEAEYKAISDGLDNAQQKQAMENLEALDFNNEVTLADSQYTDLQELQDEEKRHEGDT